MRLKILVKTLVFLTIILPLLSCTIVKHDQKNEGEEGDVTFFFEDESFDAAAYVKDNWESRIVPDVKEKAADLDRVIEALAGNPDTAGAEYGIRKEETSPYTFLVKGRYHIKEVNRDSSAGILVLDAPDASEGGFCTVQIGPVIKKSMIRDGLEFIKFDDFSNQIEFANISREINFYVRDNVAAEVDETWTPGAEVELYGAFTAAADGSVLITPVILSLTGGGANG